MLPMVRSQRVLLSDVSTPVTVTADRCLCKNPAHTHHNSVRFEQSGKSDGCIVSQFGVDASLRDAKSGRGATGLLQTEECYFCYCPLSMAAQFLEDDSNDWTVSRSPPV